MIADIYICNYIMTYTDLYPYFSVHVIYNSPLDHFVDQEDLEETPEVQAHKHNHFVDSKQHGNSPHRHRGG